MRFFSSELAHEYANSYTFGYCSYAQIEEGDDLNEAYARGYLPYTGAKDLKRYFYMARSGRVHLPSLELDSECRRVAKKFEGFSRETVPFKDFPVSDEWKQFWLDYFERSHGASVMPKERLDLILSFDIITHVGIYKDEKGVVRGYSMEVWTDTSTHDWFHAWDKEMDKTSFGMYILLDIGLRAKERGAEYYYCGTVYGNSNGASYKTNLPSLEFWDGGAWVRDEKRLKERLKTDKDRRTDLLDEWKGDKSLF